MESTEINFSNNFKVYFVLSSNYNKFDDCSEEMREAFNVFL